MEMMSEAIDETLDKDEAEEETEELTNQVILHALSVFPFLDIAGKIEEYGCEYKATAC